MKTILVTLVISLSLVAGCMKSQDATDEKELMTAETFKVIVGMQWILETMTVDGQEYELADEKPFIQISDDQRVTGFASINRFFGSMNIDSEGNVSWPMPLATTRMAGPPESMKQETMFLKILQETDRLARSGIRLYATSKDGNSELVFYVPVE